jgi:hypothetical protein
MRKRKKMRSNKETLARKRKCWLWNRGGDVDKILYHVEAEVIAV